MKAVAWAIPTLLLISAAHATRIVREHRCISPSSEAMCVLQEVFYNRSTTDSVFPKNYSHIHIGSDTTRTFRSIVPIFDGQLHKEMDEPQAVELVYVKLEILEIPRKLVLGNFVDNSLKEFWLEKGEQEPALSFLDLSRNEFSNLTNISSLVNLESLFMVGNEIKAIEANTFAGLKKLKMLNLNHNEIKTIHGADLPASLVWIRLRDNSIESLNGAEWNLPLLEYLDISDNHLKALNGAELILKKPNLREVYFGGNHFDLATVQKTTELFKRQNITYKITEDEDRDHIYCDYRSVPVNGVCVRHDQIPTHWLKATGLSLLAVLVAAVLALIVRWVFLAMGK